MLGMVDPQLSLLDTGTLLDGLVDDDSFYGRLAGHRDDLVTDADFVDCYAQGRGRPSIPPSLLLLTTLLALHDGCSDRQTAQQVRLNLGWKHALGLPVDHTGFHPTTLSVFRARIVLHDKDEQLFRVVVARAVEAKVLPRRGLALIDSSPVLGAGAVLDTYELLRKGIGGLVRAAGHDTLSKNLRRKLRRYLRETKPDIDWQDPAVRRAELARMVDAADGLLTATSGRGECDEAAGLLRRLIDQDVHRDADDGQGPAIRQQVTRDRVVSTRDPDMRHGRKSHARRFDGYKVHVVEEPGSELVTAVAVTPANASDGDIAAQLVAQAKTNGAAVTQLVGDMAYGDADTRVEVAYTGAKIVAKVPPITSGAGRFTKTDFDVDLAAAAATCPAGVTTTNLVRAGYDPHGRPVRAFAWPVSDCGPCPLRSACTTAPSRTVRLHHHEGVLQHARAAQTTAAVKRKLRRRPIIERKIDHLKDLGLGKARWRGTRNVLLQARLTAALANIKRHMTLQATAGGPLAA